MEDVEILKSSAEELIETRCELAKVCEDKESLRCSMTTEMRVLIGELDQVVKSKSDIERQHSAIKRKMEKQVGEFQDGIDALQRELNSSERTMLKVRGDLKHAQDRYIQAEARNQSLEALVDSLKREKSALAKQLEQTMSQNESLKNESSKFHSEIRTKTNSNEYLKEYSRLLETELKTIKESLQFKDQVIKQMKDDHAHAIAEVHDYHEEFSEKQKQALFDQVNVLREEMKSIRKSAHQQQRSLQSEKASSEDIEEQFFDDEGEENNDEVCSSISESFESAVESPMHHKLRSSEFDQEERDDQLQKVRSEIVSWENLFRTLDIDTYLTQIENQVDEKLLREPLRPRNAILRETLELSLRGIRQLCDYHSISMEYIL